ncbi:hypothetical protein [Roseibium litorale]|uniref:Uncharacterized protein n=1 Tax=Roseibium litorale TaxID=2803841 RepID=A0ABR9CJT6_9HYPH|nr:hypothetical protein [Roseibium litorale]MBD8890591.1 hypothetical protein [Roseibium litorale]
MTPTASIEEDFYRSLYKTAEASYLASGQDISAEDLPAVVAAILERRVAGENALAPAEAAALLRLVRDTPDAGLRAEVVKAARKVRQASFGTGVATMVPIEVTSFCSSTCRFCGWRADNKDMIRLAITETAIREQAQILARKGFSHFEIAGGDDLKFLKDNLHSLVRNLKTETSAINPDARVSLCLVPMHEPHYRKLRQDGLDCVLTWQETYKEDLYNHHIPSGPKASGIDMDLKLQKRTDESIGWLHRMQSQEMAIRAGLQVGLGVMIGLAEIAEADILSVVLHGQKLIETYADQIEPLIIGMPTWNPITTEAFDNGKTERPPFDAASNFEFVAAVYLLSFPNRMAWVFANGRVSPEIQTNCVENAAFFTSTLVQIAPGAYLGLDGKPVPRAMFDRVRGLPEGELNQQDVLSGEQFVHYYDSHENFVARFEGRGLTVVPDQSMLRAQVPATPAALEVA